MAFSSSSFSVFAAESLDLRRRNTALLLLLLLLLLLRSSFGSGGRLAVAPSANTSRRPFAIVGNKLGRACGPKVSGDSVLMDLLDAVIDRSADILERVAAEVDQVSHSIFEPDDDMVQASYNDVLKALGRKGDLTSKVRESQVSVGRLLSFLVHEAEVLKWSKEARTQIQSMQRDVLSLTDHASFLSNKITFLLDAMLGVVNIQQNAIIKIFSIMAVVFMPPTLVASIYGMNFHSGMVELDWAFGYPWALVLMLVVAILPLVYFKW